MGELGNEAGTSFPTSRDTNNTAEVNSPAPNKTAVTAGKYEDLASAIVKIQSILPLTSEEWVASSGVNTKLWGISGSGTGFTANRVQVSTSGAIWISNDVRISGFIQGALYSDSTRPAAASIPKGGMIWNTGDNAPNFSDGTNWRDAAGIIT